MFQWLIQHKHAKVVAISDLKQEKVEKFNTHLKNVQSKGADIYFGDQEEWRKLAKRDDMDLLMIATPWEWHAKMCIYVWKTENMLPVSCL